MTLWDLSEGTDSAQGARATGTSIDGRPFVHLTDPQPLGEVPVPPPPDPQLYVTYDGSRGPGKPGNAAGALAQGAENVVERVKDIFK